MTQLDPSFGNLNQSRTTNELGALNSILDSNKPQFDDSTFRPGSPTTSNYGIKTYDDRFISISANGFEELNDLSESYFSDSQYLTPIIEGGVCPNNNSEEVMNDQGGGSISSSI